MRIVRVSNRTKDVTLAERADYANSFLRRGWGLLGRQRLLQGEGIVLTHANSVHSMFMRFAFDAVYVDARGVVCHVQSDFRPNRFGPIVRKAHHVVELPAGTVYRTGTEQGDVVEWDFD